jgi:hypothetical protein
MNILRLIPNSFIIIAALLLVALNEFTDIDLPPVYSYILVIGSMLTGVWLSKSLNRKQRGRYRKR